MEQKIVVSEDNTAELNSVHRELSLREANDGSGVNLVLSVSGHADATKNKNWYIGRLLHTGKLILFRRNASEIGLQVDSNGVILAEIKQS